MKEFIWITQKGDRLKLSEMNTIHIFYALRMIWNHSVPAMYKLEGGRYNLNSQKWTNEYRRNAVFHLSQELIKRNNLPEDLQEQFDLMKNMAKEFFIKKL